MIDVKLKFNIKNRENCEKELKKTINWLKWLSYSRIDANSSNICSAKRSVCPPIAYCLQQKHISASFKRQFKERKKDLGEENFWTI